MKLRSNFVLKRIVAWKSTVLRREGFSNMPTCVGAMNHKIGYRPRTGYCCNKQARTGGRGTASQCGDHVYFIS
jgi:hypothetical protein